jgi:hypothetical protein
MLSGGVKTLVALAHHTGCAQLCMVCLSFLHSERGISLPVTNSLS